MCPYSDDNPYHNLRDHTQEEITAWVKRKRAQAVARKKRELRDAYKLVAEDINKSPKNIIKLVNAVKG